MICDVRYVTKANKTNKLPQSYLIEKGVIKERKGMVLFTNNVAIFALLYRLFILVSVNSECDDDSDCGGYLLYVCCGKVKGVCRATSCLNKFCRTDNECYNQNDRLVCCGNKCVFGSNCAGRSCSLDSDCSVNQACCHSKCVAETNCAGRSCSLDSHCSANQVCCHSKCLRKSSCLGQRCTFDSDCSSNQTCCDSKCITGKDCLRQRCNFNSDCSSGQSCCSGTCKDGLTCISKSCLSEKNCQATEICCRGTCSSECKHVGYIVGPIVAFLVVLLIIAIFLVYRRRQAKRRQPMTMDITSNVNAPNDNTGITSSICEPDYPLYQPQGQAFDQPSEICTADEPLLPC